MVDTIEKPKQIIIPAGTASESVIKIPEMGGYKLGNSSYRGDHYVHIQIKPPKKLTEKQREAILEFAKDETFKGTVNEDEEMGFFGKMKEKLSK